MANTILQLAAILGLPCALSGGAAYFAWGDLRRPRLYLLAATVALYAVYGLIFAFIGDAVEGLLSVLRGDATPAVNSGFTGLVLLKLCAKPLLGFCVMALPILAGIYMIFRRSE